MPVRRTRVRTRRSPATAELTKWQEFGFEFGWDSVFKPFPDEKAMLEAWETHGEAFTAKHAKERPGTRPAVWWDQDAPEPRRELNRAGHPDTAHYLEADGEDGRRRRGRVFVEDAGLTDFVPWLEEEADYLTRLDLLLPGEAEALGHEPPPAGLVIGSDVVKAPLRRA